MQDNKSIEILIGNDLCFVCGEKLNNRNKTVEHIFPKWLQKQFNLWDKQLTLLNHTEISYRNLTIPCCRECNSMLNKNIEKPMKDAIEFGFNKVKELDRNIIYRWINKIQYGILYKEALISFDRSQQDSLNIYPKEILEEHYLQYIILLSSLQEDTSGIEYPGSLFIFEILNDENSFNYTDRLKYNSSYFILGNLGIIAHFADGGILEDYFGKGNYLSIYQNRKLHPVQFSELCGIILYQQYRLGKYKPFYQYSVNINQKIVTSILCFNSSYVPFLKWDIKIYVECVYSFVKFYLRELNSPIELIHDEDTYLTYLKDYEGNFINYELLEK